MVKKRQSKNLDIKSRPDGVLLISILNFLAAGFVFLIGPTAIIFNDTGDQFVFRFWWLILLVTTFLAGLVIWLGVSFIKGKKLAWWIELILVSLCSIYLVYLVIGYLINFLGLNMASKIVVAFIELLYVVPFVAVLIYLTRKKVREFFK